MALELSVRRPLGDKKNCMVPCVDPSERRVLQNIFRQGPNASRACSNLSLGDLPEPLLGNPSHDSPNLQNHQHT